MTDAAGRVTREELQAYFDDALPPDRRAAVAIAIASDPALAAEVAVYEAQKNGLHALYDPVLHEAIPERLLGALHQPRAPQGRPRPARRGWSIAASILLLVIGGASGWVARDEVMEREELLDPFIEQAVLAHRLFESEAGEKQASLKLDPAGQFPEGAVSSPFDVPMRAPTLADLQFIPVAFRRTTGDAATVPSAQLFYRDAQNRRITLYTRAHSTVSDVPFRSEQTNGLTVLYWLDGPLVYVLVGDVEPEELKNAAEAVYRSPGLSALPERGAEGLKPAEQ